jgi:hypothetical protein
MLGGCVLQGQAAPFCQPPVYDGLVGTPPIVLTYDYFGTLATMPGSARSLIQDAAHLWTTATAPDVAYPSLSTGSNPNLEIRWWKFPVSVVVVKKEVETLGHAEFPLIPALKWNWVYDMGYNSRTERAASPTLPAHFGMQLSEVFINDPLGLYTPLFFPTATHEFGHLIGLDHVPVGCPSSSSIMVRAGATLTTLSASDHAAVKARVVTKKKY